MNTTQGIAIVNDQYLVQINLTKMGSTNSADLNINAMVFPMIGGMEFPTNPQLQRKLAIKANSSGYEPSNKQKVLTGSFAMYMEDFLFYQGSLKDLISNRRAVFIPEEIEYVSLIFSDFLIY